MSILNHMDCIESWRLWRYDYDILLNDMQLMASKSNSEVDINSTYSTFWLDMIHKNLIWHV